MCLFSCYFGQYQLTCKIQTLIRRLYGEENYVQPLGNSSSVDYKVEEILIQDVNVAKKAAKPNLGEKQLCPECEKKFYDLSKRPAVCPYCSTSFDPAEIVAVVAAAPKPVKAKPKKADKDIDDDIDDEEEVDPEDIDEEDIDQDEAAAKELELDGDASFGGSGGDDDGDDSGKDAPDMDGFSTRDADEEDGVSDDDDDEQDILPPTDNGDEDDEEDEE